MADDPELYEFSMTDLAHEQLTLVKKLDPLRSPAQPVGMMLLAMTTLHHVFEVTEEELVMLFDQLLVLVRDKPDGALRIYTKEPTK